MEYIIKNKLLLTLYKFLTYIQKIMFLRILSILYVVHPIYIYITLIYIWLIFGYNYLEIIFKILK